LKDRKRSWRYFSIHNSRILVEQAWSLKANLNNYGPYQIYMCTLRVPISFSALKYGFHSINQVKTIAYTDVFFIFFLFKYWSYWLDADIFSKTMYIKIKTKIPHYRNISKFYYKNSRNKESLQIQKLLLSERGNEYLIKKCQS
jgi:hypothetical protein